MTPQQRLQQAAFKDAIAHMDVVCHRLLEEELFGAHDEARRFRNELHRQYAEFLAPLAADVVADMGLPV